MGRPLNIWWQQAREFSPVQLSFDCLMRRHFPECIQAVKITYREYVRQGATSSPIGVRFGETNIKNAETDAMTAPMVPRRARLKPEDFDKLGYTIGCPGCDQLQIGGPARRNHNEVCRDRIEAELMKSELEKTELGKPKTG